MTMMKYDDSSVSSSLVVVISSLSHNLYIHTYMHTCINTLTFNRYVIFPIQVLAKSCKPVPVMIMGALMGKKYPLRKYLNVCLIVLGVGLFMGGGSSHKKQPPSATATATTESDQESTTSNPMQIFGIILLFISLCFDGGTGAYEDKLMAVHHVGPFDLMYNIQLGKTIIAGVALVVLNQVHVFVQMCQEMGFVLVALGLTGAMGQVFIFVTIAKFGMWPRSLCLCL